MSLFPPSAMSDDRIAQTLRTEANDLFATSHRPVKVWVAIVPRKWDKENRIAWRLSHGAEPCQDKRPQESLLPPLPRNLNRGRINRFPSLSIDWFPWIGRSSAQNPIPYLPPCLHCRDGLPIVPMLRHGRPSLWANRESSRTIAAECFGCQIWIIANWQCLTVSARQPRAASMNTPSTSSLP